MIEIIKLSLLVVVSYLKIVINKKSNYHENIANCSYLSSVVVNFPNKYRAKRPLYARQYKKSLQGRESFF